MVERDVAEPIAATIEREVQSWPNVTVERHSAEFVEFRVGRRELGHLHGSRLADFPFPLRIREQLVAAGKAQLHYLHPQTGWVSFYIRGEVDVPALVDLFRLNYERPWLVKQTS